MMKTSTLFKFMLAVILTGATILNAHAQRVVINDADNTALTIVSQDMSHLEMKNTISEFNYRILNTEEGLFTSFSTHVNAYSGKVGEPRIPVIRKLIEIPLGAELKINNLTYTEETIDLGEMGVIYPAFPVQLPVEKGDAVAPPFQYNEQAYSENRFYGEKLVNVEVKGILRGQRLALVTIAPYAYNPVSNTMKVYSNVQFDIAFENADLNATMELKKKTWSPHFQSDYMKTVNAKAFDFGKDPLSSYPITYVIISDRMFEAQLQEFIAWKQKKGYKVITGYTDEPEVGSTTTSIKAFIQGHYENPQPGFTPPTYVLFVGDVAQVPAFTGTTNSHVTDLYYCEYTNDDFPEIYYGRFSAQTTDHLQPQIDKTLMVEQYTMPDPSYLDEVVLVAGMDGSHGNNWGNGQINYGTENYFNEDHGITSHVYLYPQSGSNAAAIKAKISEGVSYVNYSAHCSSNGWADPSFTSSEVHNLTNENEYFLSVGNCCQSNAFDSQECFGEAMMRAENKASIGHIGGTNSTYWDEDYYWGVGVGAITEDPPTYEETTLGVYDCLFHEHGEEWADWCFTSGQIIFSGNRAVSESGSDKDTYYWEIYSVMGDPSIAMYITVPDPIDVSYDALMPLGSETFTVTTEPFAYVAISREGELFGAALADETGTAVVVMDPPIATPGNCDVVVTKQWGEPFFGEVLVASPDGPYVLMSNCVIDDSQGNNNGLADYSETIMLDIELNNLGNSDATGVNATISCADPDITITQNSAAFGDIASQATVSQSGAFTFEVNQVIEDMKRIEIMMDITDGSETWSSKMNITLHAPVPAIGNFTIDDTAGGDGNGRLDAGETADITFMVYNQGSADIANVEGTLLSPSPEITINSGNASVEQILASGSETMTFNITVDQDVSVGTVVELNMAINGSGYDATKDFTSSIGLVLEDFESGDFNNFNWTFGTYPWEIVEGGEAFEGNYAIKSSAITDDQDAELKLTIEVLSENDSISFFRKVSSEDTYDHLRFYVDGVEMDAWSGEEAWDEAKFPLSQGIHELIWAYEKDYSVFSGSDCAWIDYIIFPSISDYVGVNELLGLKNESMSVYPNPFNNKTRIAYTLGDKSDVSVMVYNMIGERIQIIENAADRRAGTYTHEFDGSSLEHGIYFCVMKTNSQTITKKIIITE